MEHESVLSLKNVRGAAAYVVFKRDGSLGPFAGRIGRGFVREAWPNSPHNLLQLSGSSQDV